MTARNVVPQASPPRGFLRRRKSDAPYPHQVAPVEPVAGAVEVAPVAEPPAYVAPPANVEPGMHVEPAAPYAVALSAAEPEDDGLWLFDAVPEADSCPRCQVPAESDELSRAQASLLQAALRQAEELEAALATEQYARQEETARLRADNELLRDARASLNAEAIHRQAEVEAALPRDAFYRRVPEERAHTSPPLETPQLVAPQVHPPQAVAPQVHVPEVELPHVHVPQPAPPQVRAPQLEAHGGNDGAVGRHGRRRSGRPTGPA